MLVKRRSDIQGLRGIAVLAVLADHFAPDIRLTSGGFIGVDIFFVISGFLITTNILRELENNRFSLRMFWTRRAKRILPSLIIVLLITSLLIWTTTSEYVKYEFLRNLTKAVTFTSNLGYSQTQDYFEGQRQNPLLHLWSLAIEEQFYLVWPLVCVLFFKIGKKFLLLASCLIALVSLFANLTTVYYFENRSSAFFHTFTRVWELLLGAILAQHLFRRKFPGFQESPHSQTFSAFGLVLIILSLTFTNENSKFPGLLALLPTLGTCAIIFAGPLNAINRIVLGNRLLIWFGGISYALYLWHYPLIFLMRFLHPGRTNLFLLILTGSISVLFAFISTKFIEDPIRQLPIKTVSFKFLIIPMAVLVAFSITSQKLAINKFDQNFILDRYSALGWGNQSNLSCLRLRKEITVKTLRRQGCFAAPDDNSKFVFLVGDSHSGSLRAGLEPFLARQDISLYGVSTGWCAWWEVNPPSEDQICADINQEFFDSISRSKPKLLIIDGYWAKIARAYDVEEVLIEYINFVQSLGVEKVIIVGQVPTYELGLPQFLKKNFLDVGHPIPKLTHRAQVRNDPAGTQEYMKKIPWPPQVSYRSIDDLLCNDDLCKVTVGPNIMTDLVVWDYGHLTEPAATFVSEKLFADIDQFLRN